MDYPIPIIFETHCTRSSATLRPLPPWPRWPVAVVIAEIPLKQPVYMCNVVTEKRRERLALCDSVSIFICYSRKDEQEGGRDLPETRKQPEGWRSRCRRFFQETPVTAPCRGCSTKMEAEGGRRCSSSPGCWLVCAGDQQEGRWWRRRVTDFENRARGRGPAGIMGLIPVLWNFNRKYALWSLCFANYDTKNPLTPQTHKSIN